MQGGELLQYDFFIGWQNKKKNNSELLSLLYKSSLAI